MAPRTPVASRAGPRAPPRSRSRRAPRAARAASLPRTSLHDASGSPSPSTPSATSDSPTPASGTSRTPSHTCVGHDRHSAVRRRCSCTRPRTAPPKPGARPWRPRRRTASRPWPAPPTASAKYLLGPVAVDGKDITGASAGIPQNGTAWVVNVSFNSAGSQAFGDTTKAIYQKQSPQNQFAIVLDGQVVSAPGAQRPDLRRRRDQRQLHPAGRHHAGQPAEVRLAAAAVRRGRDADHLPDARAATS